MPHSRAEELRSIFGSAPFVAELGIEVEELDAGVCQTSLVVQAKHRQREGFVHAGVQATLADHSAGGAAATLAPEGHTVLTLEFKINLLRPAEGERLRCRARVLRPGRQFTVVESEVFAVTGDAEKLVSKAIVTLAVVPVPRAALGT